MSSNYLVPLVSRSPSRRLHGHLAIMVAAAIVLGACSAGTAAANTPAPQDVARVDHACGVTLQLNPTEEEFAMCKESLLGSLAGMKQQDTLERERAGCLARGLTVGTPAFALCVLDAEPASSTDR